MPFPKLLTRVNKAVTNRVMIHMADHPPFAALRHVGRSSGRRYRIPINAFPTESGFVFALTYGRDTDWVKNVMAAGRADLDYGGETISLSNPRFVGNERASAAIPSTARLLLSLLHVDEFLELSRTGNR